MADGFTLAVIPRRTNLRSVNTLMPLLDIMFPFFSTSFEHNQKCSPKVHKERKLKFLKWIRDDLETRLAGVNASISTLESQIEREETT